MCATVRTVAAARRLASTATRQRWSMCRTCAPTSGAGPGWTRPARRCGSARGSSDGSTRSMSRPAPKRTTDAASDSTSCPAGGHLALGEISASAETEWLKQLQQRYATSTVVTLRTILSMILDDAIDERSSPPTPYADDADAADAATTFQRRASGSGPCPSRCCASPMQSHCARWTFRRIARNYRCLDWLPKE